MPATFKSYRLFASGPSGDKREIWTFDAIGPSDAWEIALQHLELEDLEEDERPLLVDGQGKSIPSVTIM